MKSRCLLVAFILCFVYRAFGDNYYPLSIGNYWVYHMSNNLYDSIAITDTIIKDNNTYYVHHNFMGYTRDSMMYVCEYHTSCQDNWIYEFEYGINTVPCTSTCDFKQTYLPEGEKWRNSVIAGYREAISWGDTAITVPAGTFQSCYYICGDGLSESFPNYLVAPGIGMIYQHKHFTWKHYKELISYYIEGSTNIDVEHQLMKTQRRQPTVIRKNNAYIVNVASLQKPISISLFTLQGKSVYTFNDIKNQEFEMPHLQKGHGLYILTIQGKDNQYSCKLLE